MGSISVFNAVWIFCSLILHTFVHGFQRSSLKHLYLISFYQVTDTFVQK